MRVPIAKTRRETVSRGEYNVKKLYLFCDTKVTVPEQKFSNFFCTILLFLILNDSKFCSVMYTVYLILGLKSTTLSHFPFEMMQFQLNLAYFLSLVSIKPSNKCKLNLNNISFEWFSAIKDLVLMQLKLILLLVVPEIASESNRIITIDKHD